MRKTLLSLSLAIMACVADVRLASSAEVRPRIRAVTVFIDIDPNNYAARIQDAQKFLAAAKDALNKAGFEGAGGRITTQPFPQFTKGMKTEDAVAFIGKLREAASKERSGLNIGAAMVHDNDDPAAASLLVEILSKVSVNANLIRPTNRAFTGMGFARQQRSSSNFPSAARMVMRTSILARSR